MSIYLWQSLLACWLLLLWSAGGDGLGVPPVVAFGIQTVETDERTANGKNQTPRPNPANLGGAFVAAWRRLLPGFGSLWFSLDRVADGSFVEWRGVNP
jgi:hypothetical protein